MNRTFSTLFTPISTALRQMIQFLKKEGYYAQAPKLSSKEKNDKAKAAINKTITVVGITPTHIYAGFEGTPFKVDVENPNTLKLGDTLYVYGIEDNDTLLCIPSNKL